MVNLMCMALPAKCCGQGEPNLQYSYNDRILLLLEYSCNTIILETQMVAKPVLSFCRSGTSFAWLSAGAAFQTPQDSCKHKAQIERHLWGLQTGPQFQIPRQQNPQMCSRQLIPRQCLTCPVCNFTSCMGVSTSSGAQLCNPYHINPQKATHTSWKAVRPICP